MPKNKKALEKKWKELEHEQMKEEAHQLEMQSAYEQDEVFEESKD